MFLRLFLVIGVSLAAPTQLCITHSCHSIRTSPALDSCAVSGLEMLCSHFTRTENSIRPTISSDGVYGSGQYLCIIRHGPIVPEHQIAAIGHAKCLCVAFCANRRIQVFRFIKDRSVDVHKAVCEADGMVRLHQPILPRG